MTTSTRRARSQEDAASESGDDEQDAPRSRWARPVRLALGVLFLLLGLVGLVVPVLQGILFLCIAALLLAPDVPPVRRLVLKAFRRWPKLRRRIPERFRRLARSERR